MMKKEKTVSDDLDAKLTAQSQEVHKQLHTIGLVIGIVMVVTTLVLILGAGYKIYSVYLDFAGGDVEYSTLSDINTIVAFCLLVPITLLTSIIFFYMFKSESPFSSGNITRIRVIAIILMLLSILPITVQVLVAALNGFKIGFTVNLMYIFIGLIIFCLSFVFKHGSIVQQKTDEIINVQEQVILAFAEITEAKSGQTGQHVKRVSEYCRILAEGMGMSNAQVENLRLASMMHDVGKLLIPNEILEKESSLTDEEYNIMKTHVTIGEQLLHNATGEIMEEARLVALDHHEQWNGNGYLGKKGEEISLPARIVAVADVFDALVSARSYKTGWDPNKVYSMIIDESGKKFDPEIVNVFIRNYNKMMDVYNKFSNNSVREASIPKIQYKSDSAANAEKKAKAEESSAVSREVDLDLRRLI